MLQRSWLARSLLAASAMLGIGAVERAIARSFESSAKGKARRRRRRRRALAAWERRVGGGQRKKRLRTRNGRRSFVRRHFGAKQAARSLAHEVRMLRKISEFAPHALAQAFSADGTPVAVTMSFGRADGLEATGVPGSDPVVRRCPDGE